MSDTQTPSAACCNTPPVVASGYKEKGQFSVVDGLKTYSTGPTNAERGILVIYDIFGYWPQTLQGADILAYSDTEHANKVFMPDWFEGSPASIDWYPPDTDEKGRKLGEFFQTTAAPPKTVKKVSTVLEQLKTDNPGIKSWGVLGFCWGGKIVNLVSQEGTPFKAAAACHPAMVDANDAPKVSIPILLIPSKDESKEDVGKYGEALKVKNKIQWFDDQIHGFMAARGNLADDKVSAAYEKGYQLVLSWFHEHLG